MLSARPLGPANAMHSPSAFAANGTGMAAPLKPNMMNTKASASPAASVSCYGMAPTIVTPAQKGFPVKVVVQDQPVKSAPIISTPKPVLAAPQVRRGVVLGLVPKAGGARA